MNTKKDFPVELTQEQLEWATQKSADQPRPADASESQMEELESLEQTWEWFGSLLENAKDEDFLPANAVDSKPADVVDSEPADVADSEPTPPVQLAIEQKPYRSRISYFIAIGTVSAAFLFVCGFWTLRMLNVSAPNATNNQVAQNTTVTDTTVEAPIVAPTTEPAQPQTTVAVSDTFDLGDIPSWGEDKDYQDQVAQLWASINDSESRDRSEEADMADYLAFQDAMSQISNEQDI